MTTTYQFIKRLIGRAMIASASMLPLGCSSFGTTDQSFPLEPKPVTVAFIGDQGVTEYSRKVLELIVAEGADLIMHQGDLDYEDDPDRWDSFVSDILGPDFPILVSIGNNDNRDGLWHAPNGYQYKLQSRLNRVDELSCSGDLGVQSVCTFRGLFFVLSGIGTVIEKDDPAHVKYIRDQLARTGAQWRICSFHRTQTLMQVGGKRDQVGWGPFRACREGGAIVATAHEHSYSRTYLMANFETQDIASTADTLVIEEGTSFAFVSGLGGESIREQYRWGEPWWAAIYTSTQGADYGALFCTFFVDSDPGRATCYFKDIDGNIPDRFELISRVGGS